MYRIFMQRPLKAMQRKIEIVEENIEEACFIKLHSKKI